MSIARPPTYRVRKPPSMVHSMDPRLPKQAPKPASVPRPTIPQTPSNIQKINDAWAAKNPGVASPNGTIFGSPPNPSDPGGSGGQPAASVGTPSTPGAPPQASGAPFPTGAGAELRTSGTEDYGSEMANVNRRILEAAMNYGGVDKVQQVGLDEGGNDVFNNVPVAQSPNSRIATIARSLTDQTRGLNEDLNNRNSYFSGAHLEGQGKLDDAAGRDRLSAKTEYDSALADLMTELARARAARDKAMRDADSADINASAATEPVAEDSPATGTTDNQPDDTSVAVFKAWVADGQPKHITEDKFGRYGFSVTFEGGKAVVKNVRGETIPGATWGIGGKSRYINLP